MERTILMDAPEKYIPKKGHIVWVIFDLSSGNEIKKRRPSLVVSRYEFNRSTLVVVFFVYSFLDTD